MAHNYLGNFIKQLTEASSAVYDYAYKPSRGKGGGGSTSFSTRRTPEDYLKPTSAGIGFGYRPPVRRTPEDYLSQAARTWRQRKQELLRQEAAMSPTGGIYKEGMTAVEKAPFAEAIKREAPEVLYSLKAGLTGTMPQSYYGGLQRALEESPYPVPPEYKVREQAKLQEKVNKARAQYAKLTEQHNRWVKQHPELEPAPEYLQGVKQAWADPRLKGRRGEYLAYHITRAMLPTVAALAAGTAVGVVAGPVAGGAVSAGLFFPLEHKEVFDAVVSAGGTQEQAAELAGIMTPMISAVEGLGDVFQIDAITGGLFKKALRQGAVQSLKATIPRLIVKGAVTALVSNATETVTEVVQEGLKNAAVKFIDDRRSLWENLPEVALESFVTFAPLSLIGGAGGAVRMGRERGVQAPQLEVPEGIKVAMQEPERGGIKLPEGEPPVTPTAPVTPEVTGIPLESPIGVVRQGLAKLFGEGRLTVTPSEFWAKFDELNASKANTSEGSEVWRSLGRDIGIMRRHIEDENISRIPEVTPTAPVTPEIIGITEGINRAVTEHSYRLEHGFKGKTTGFTGFWITKEGKIVQHSLLKSIPVAERSGLVNVHSHSSIGWQQRLEEGKLDPFDPLNAGDVINLQTDVKNNWSDTIVVIMGDGRMEILHVPSTARAGFLQLSKTKIREALSPTGTEQMREALRLFAKEHGLEYQTGLSWKAEPPVVTPGKPPTTEMTMPEDPDAEAKRVYAEFEKIHQYYKEKRQNEQETKQALVDFAKSLPVEVRAKLLATVKNVQTPLGLARAFDRIGELMNEYQAKVLQTAIRKELSTTQAKRRAGKLYGKFTAEVQSNLDFIRRHIKLTSSAIDSLIAENTQKMVDGTIDDDEGAQINALLSMSNIKGMNNTELQTVLDAIRSLKTTGRTEILQKRMEARKKRIGFETIKEAIQALNNQMSQAGTQIARAIKQEIKNKAIQVLTGIPTIGPEIITGRKTIIQRMVRFGDDYIAVTNMMESFLDSLDSYEDKGLFKQIIWEGINSAYDAKLRGSDAIMARFDKFLKDENINLGKVELRQAMVGGKEMRASDRIGIYLASRDEQARNHILKGNSITEQNMTEAKNSLNAEEKKLADWLREFYDTQFASEAELHELITGTKLKKRENYFPIFILKGEVGGEISMSEAEAAQNLMAKQSLFPSQLVGEGHRKMTVKGAAQPIDIDAIATFDRYIHETEQDKAFSLIARDLQQILKDRQFAKNFKSNYGDSAYQSLSNWLKRSVATYPQAVNNRFEGVIRTLRQNAATFALAFNVLSGARATLSYWNGAAELGNLGALQGLVSTLVDSKGTEKLQRQYSPQAWHRVAEREFAEMQSAKRLSQRNRLSMKEWLSILYRINDKITVNAIWRGAYDEYLRKNETAKEEEAARYADEVMRKTQPTYTMKDIAEIYNSGELAKAMTMFTNQLNRNWNYMRFDVIGKLQAGKISPMTAAHRVVTGYVIPSLLLYLLASGLKPPKKPEDWAKAVGKNFIAMIPVVGTYISAAMDGYMFSGLITTEVFEAMQNAVYQINKGNWDKAALGVATAIGVAVGAPINPVRKVWEAAEAVVKKEGNPLMTLVYGEYRATQLEKLAPEEAVAQVIKALGTIDTEAKEEDIKKETEKGASAARLKEIEDKDYTTTTSNLGSTIRSRTKDMKPSERDKISPLVTFFWAFNAEDKIYEGLSTDEKEAYIKAHPDYDLKRLFWNDDNRSSATTSQKTKLRELAKQFGIPENAIPALTKKTNIIIPRTPKTKTDWSKLYAPARIPGTTRTKTDWSKLYAPAR